MNGRPSESMGRLGDPLGRAYEANGAGDRMLFKVGNVAVIPVEGTLVHKGKFLGAYSGETSYEGLQARVARAMRDPSVKGVVFEVDSYGGEVAGAFDTAEMIYALSQQKPTLAILTDFAYSAGYLLAAAARQIVMPSTGGAGSIGVVTLHVDYSGKLEADGIKVTVLAAGDHKGEGNEFAPLAEDVAARILEKLEATRQEFAAAVGRYRGVRLTKNGALATQALGYRGEDAVKAGLADQVMRPTTAFEQFVALV
jgi:signal peptide peptidase SppA